jgi:DNA invertase Pin-like site-specific DNA recombinase
MRALAYIRVSTEEQVSGQAWIVKKRRAVNMRKRKASPSNEMMFFVRREFQQSSLTDPSLPA